MRAYMCVCVCVCMICLSPPELFTYFMPVCDAGPLSAPQRLLFLEYFLLRETSLTTAV